MDSTETPNTAAPIDSEVPIVKFSAWYGVGNVSDAGSDPLQIRIFIFDARKKPDGENFRNELYILKDSAYSKLPEAFQLPNGVIRFFAYESQLSSILLMLSNFNQLWLKSTGGRVSIISGVKSII